MLNYFVFYTLLITKSSFEIGSLPAKVTKDKFYISAHKVLWLTKIFWYIVFVKNIFYYKTLQTLLNFSDEITFIHFLRDFHFLKVIKKLYLQISLKAFT